MRLQPKALGERGNPDILYLSPEYLILIFTGSSSSPDKVNLFGLDHLSKLLSNHHAAACHCPRLAAV